MPCGSRPVVGSVPPTAAAADTPSGGETPAITCIGDSPAVGTSANPVQTPSASGAVPTLELVARCAALERENSALKRQVAALQQQVTTLECTAHTHAHDALVLSDITAGNPHAPVLSAAEREQLSLPAGCTLVATRGTVAVADADKLLAALNQFARDHSGQLPYAVAAYITAEAQQVLGAFAHSMDVTTPDYTDSHSWYNLLHRFVEERDHHSIHMDNDSIHHRSLLHPGLHRPTRGSLTRPVHAVAGAFARCEIRLQAMAHRKGGRVVILGALIGLLLGIVVAGVAVGVSIWYEKPDIVVYRPLIPRQGEFDQEEGPWGYGDGPKGPALWGSLKDETTGELLYPACAPSNTALQSPIDVPWRVDGAIEPLVRNYTAKRFEIISRPGGHPGFQVKPVDGQATLLVDGVPYSLTQLHFHSPSEHTIDGRQLPLEMHMVHTSGSNIAVFGVLFNSTDASNPYLRSWWDEIYHETVLDEIDLAGLVGDTVPYYYRYQGSLTTPPCTEGVKWFLTMSQTGINELERVVYEWALNNLQNFRPPQAGNGRSVHTLRMK